MTPQNQTNFDHGLEASPPWFSPQKNTSSWSTADIRAKTGKCGWPTGNCGWTQTDVGESWRKAHAKDYAGVGWYETRFALPARMNASAGIGRLELVVAARVCGATASGWLNGQPMPPAKNVSQALHGQVALGSLRCQEMVWRLRPLGNNHIAFRIDSGAAGGASPWTPGLVSKVFVLSNRSRAT